MIVARRRRRRRRSSTPRPRTTAAATIGVLLGNGDGTFAPPTTDHDRRAHAVDRSRRPRRRRRPRLGAVELRRRLLALVRERRHAATSRFVEEFTAPSNPSCAVLLDFDNDGDLDMALTDEIADVVVLVRNGGRSRPAARSAPSRAAAQPLEAGKSKLTHQGQDAATRATASSGRGRRARITRQGGLRRSDEHRPATTSASTRTARSCTASTCPAARSLPDEAVLSATSATASRTRTATARRTASWPRSSSRGRAGKANDQGEGQGRPASACPDVGRAHRRARRAAAARPTAVPASARRYSPPFTKHDGVTLLALSTRRR